MAFHVHQEAPTFEEPVQVAVDRPESRLIRHVVPIQVQEAVARIVQDTRNDYQVEPEIWVYGRKLSNPWNLQYRSTVSKGHVYGKSRLAKAQPLSQDMDFAIAWANNLTGAEYNGILISQYTDGTKFFDDYSVDKLGVDPEGGVLTIAYGVDRMYRIRERGTKQPVKDVPVKHGEATQMTGKFQHQFTHALLSEPHTSGECVLLTFRKHCTHMEKMLWSQQMAQIEGRKRADQEQQDRKKELLDQLAEIKAQRAEREKIEIENRERVKRKRELKEHEQEAIRKIAMRAKKDKEDMAKVNSVPADEIAKMKRSAMAGRRSGA